MQRLLTDLRPDSGSDAALAVAKLAVNAAGDRAIKMRGVLSRHSSSFFWVIDIRNRTYRLFRLTGNDDDVTRIHQYLEQLGAKTTLDHLRNELQQALTERPPLGSTAGSDQLQGPLPRWEEGDCSGQAAVAIQTWDPALITLTDTAISAAWTRDANWFRWTVYWDCWANPWTGFSSWFTDSWAPSVASAYDYLDASVFCTYHNDDFGDPNERTWVYQNSAVNYWHGDITWDTYHYDEGEFASLIYGVTRLGTIETTC